jgi:hypothetical protein
VAWLAINPQNITSQRARWKNGVSAKETLIQSAARPELVEGQQSSHWFIIKSVHVSTTLNTNGFFRAP